MGESVALDPCEEIFLQKWPPWKGIRDEYQKGINLNDNNVKMMIVLTTVVNYVVIKISCNL